MESVRADNLCDFNILCFRTPLRGVTFPKTVTLPAGEERHEDNGEGSRVVIRIAEHISGAVGKRFARIRASRASGSGDELRRFACLGRERGRGPVIEGDHAALTLVIARSAATKPSRAAQTALDCFASLAMTKNDVMPGPPRAKLRRTCRARPA